jgi:hypothetical protein
MDSASGIAALDYVEGGFHVFPCLTNKKEPATRRGYKNATLDTSMIAEWWDKRPDLNVAIATGFSELVVIDLDVKEDGPNGLINYLRLVEEHAGGETPTREVTTPSGGVHLYYRLPEGSAPIKCSASKLAPGIDIRAEGGYVVAPPSTVDGVPYVVTEDRPIVDLPSWLHKLLLPAPRELLVPKVFPRSERHPGVTGQHGYQHDEGSSPKYAVAALGYEVQRVYNAPKGKRNTELNTAAFSLFRLVAGGCLNEDVVENQLTAAALYVGLSAEEIRKTLKSGRDAGFSSPRYVA